MVLSFAGLLGFLGDRGCVVTDPIRVLVAIRPRLVRQSILATFAGQPDIEVVGEITEESQIFESVNKTLPNFVLVTLNDAGIRPKICDDLLQSYPGVRVIAVAPSKIDIVHYWMSADIRSTRMEASEEGLLSTLRSKLIKRGELKLPSPVQS